MSKTKKKARPAPTLMLIDGHSLTYRAFFALPADMATASGQVTNAVYGFTAMLINLFRDHTPDHIAVAFDLPEPTFRHERVSTYKDGREKAPDILLQQLGLVRQVVEALNIPIVERSGFEADDVIATLATEGRDRECNVIVVTGDRDSYQLVEDPWVKVLYNKRGVSDYAFYDEAGIEERTGVHPNLYVPYAALRGDKSDNLPGVPGVGEKTAAKLINKYGGISGIYENMDDHTPKLTENLAANEENVRLNEEVMVLIRDVPLDVSVDELRMGGFDPNEVRELFDFLEFRTLYDRLADALSSIDVGIDMGPSIGGAKVIEAEVTELDDPGLAAVQVKALASGEATVAMAVAWADEPGTSAVTGLAVVTDAENGGVIYLPQELFGDKKLHAALTELMAHGTAPVAMHDSKAAMRGLLGEGFTVGSLALDTSIAGYLLDPADSGYALEDLLLRYANMELPESDAPPAGQLALGDPDADEADSVGKITGRQAIAVAFLVGPLTEALETQGLDNLNSTIEVPLIAALARMEHIGVGVDRAELERLRDHLGSEADRLKQLVQDEAGEEFNVNSTPQLREILFEKLGLTPGKKTKTGYSTDAATLEKLRDQHPIVEHLLSYREVEKLRSTYGQGLVNEIGDGDRIRATFNQTVARTGRLSSDKPNLHNIPVRTEMGRAFRRAFVAADGFELLVADYNQIELRCIAHLAQDPGLIAAFEAGDDIHTATAARIFAIDPDNVRIEQRSKAKMVSYGLAYGMEAYGLGQRLSIPTSEAQEILDAYFEAFPAVKQYMEDTVSEARERGYTETLFGRRRKIPELSSPNFRIRQAGERQAMNAGIQGLAADIFKVALVRIDEALQTRKLASRLTLQVHDEVMLEVPAEEKDEVAQMVTDLMGDAFDLRVPLEVDLAFGPNWADAKG